MVHNNNHRGYELGRRLVKGPRRSVPQADVDKSTTGSNQSLNILQINTCGISNKKTELSKALNDNNVHVLLAQETLHHNTNPRLPNYTHYCCDCPNCRGVVTYIRNDVPGDVTNIDTPQPTDIQTASIWFFDTEYKIHNIYNPPQNELDTTYFFQLRTQNVIIAGDFNGHSPQWGYQNYNRTGKQIEELCESTNLSVLQDASSTPTLLHRVHNTLSRPDLTIVSSNLEQITTTEVIDGIGSDHKPTLIKVFKKQQKQFERRPRWNFRKANWEGYRNAIDENLDTSQCESAEQLNESLITAILAAAKENIPRGCRKNYKPFWNEDIDHAVKERKAARKQLEQFPTTENKIQYNRTSAIVKKTVKSAKRAKWASTCRQLDLKKDGKKAWSLVNNLCNETPKRNPKPIKSKDGTIVEDQNKAEAFNKHFAKVNKAGPVTDTDKIMLKNLKKIEKSPRASISLFEEPFTMTELHQAMKKLKTRKSPGPDKVFNEMLLHLSQLGKETLLKVVNLSWTSGNVPSGWRNAILSPILKKNKPPEDLASYRPISLTSCIGKIAERMINTRLYWWLEKTQTLNNQQAGFRAGFRTEDQLFRLTQKIIDGFHDNKQTTAIFVDLKQAYDRVWRKGLLYKMMEAGVHGNLYRWIKSFLTDRTIQTRVNNGLSSKAVLEEGLPQGSALSCTLFLLFINDLPDILETEKAMYADDIAMWHTSKHLPIATKRLNEDLARLENYCENGN